MRLHRVLPNVVSVQVVVGCIANSMVRKASLPHLALALKLRGHSSRESAFDELDGALEASHGANQDVEMIGHDDKFMKEICRTSVSVERFNQQPGPGFRAKPWTA